MFLFCCFFCVLFSLALFSYLLCDYYLLFLFFFLYPSSPFIILCGSSLFYFFLVVDSLVSSSFLPCGTSLPSLPRSSLLLPNLFSPPPFFLVVLPTSLLLISFSLSVLFVFPLPFSLLLPYSPSFNRLSHPRFPLPFTSSFFLLPVCSLFPLSYGIILLPHSSSLLLVFFILFPYFSSFFL